MADSVNLAILGCAHPHHQAWLKVLDQTTKARLVAIWDHQPERGRTVAGQAGAQFEPDLDKLLSRGDLDAVMIAAENSRHADLTVAAAEARKHVMCEKPMATTLAECDRMIEAVNRSGIKYYQVFPMRFDPVNLKIKELLDSRVLGRISSVRKRHGHYYGLEWQKTEPDIWFANTAFSGGGAFLDEGVHVADWFCWMFGQPMSVMAQIDTVQTPFAVDDLGVAIYRFPGKVMGLLQSSWLDRAATNTTEIYGEFGTIIQSYTDGASFRTMAEPGQPLKLYTLEGRSWQHFDIPIYFPRNQEAVVQPFIDCLLQDTAPPVTAADGKRALKVILAAYQSAREGRLVEI